MTVTNRQSGTNVHEVADGIYRVNTPVKIEGAGGFSFNQYVIVDDEPLLFHTGLRKMFPVVREAVASILPVERLRYIAFSHVEADECGSLNEWLVAAPQSVPLCGNVAAMVSRRPCRSGAPRVRRWRAAPSGSALCALVRHAASAARVGMWLSDGRTDLDAVVWRPVHAGRLGSSPHHGVGHSWAERGFPPQDGLLFIHEECACDAREAILDKPGNTRVHARQRMAGRWGKTVACSC